MMNPPQQLNNTAIATASRSTDFLVIENLVKSYARPDGSQAVILDGIDLTVSEDEFISIIGHSGCGKSTLLKQVWNVPPPAWFV